MVYEELCRLKATQSRSLPKGEVVIGAAFVTLIVVLSILSTRAIIFGVSALITFWLFMFYLIFRFVILRVVRGGFSGKKVLVGNAIILAFSYGRV